MKKITQVGRQHPQREKVGWIFMTILTKFSTRWSDFVRLKIFWYMFSNVLKNEKVSL